MGACPREEETPDPRGAWMVGRGGADGSNRGHGRGRTRHRYRAGAWSGEEALDPPEAWLGEDEALDPRGGVTRKEEAPASNLVCRCGILS